MANDLLFMPADPQVTKTSDEARILSLALHAYLSTLIFGQALHEGMKETDAGSRFAQCVAQHTMSLFPVAGIDTDLGAFEQVAKRLGLELTTPEAGGVN